MKKDHLQSREELNRKLVLRFFNEAYLMGDISLIDKIFGRNFTGPNCSHGTAEVKRSILEYRQAFPDLQITIEDMAAKEDVVAVRFTFIGTHKGKLFNLPPTGKVLKLASAHTFRISDGKIVEMT